MSMPGGYFKTFDMKTITEKNINYPVLNADANGYIICPFCNNKHKHGILGGDGHRIPHCDYDKVSNIVYIDGKLCEKQNGYIVNF